MKKSNNKLVVTLLITIVCFVVGGLLVYNFTFKNANSNESLEEIENKELPEWAKYLEGFNLVLTESVWNQEKEECQFEKISISSNNFKKILNELSSANITKYYYGGNPPTGTICSERYKVEYGNNSISLEADGIAWVTDKTLSDKLDLTITDTNGTGDYVYKFNIDFASVINKYKTTK